MHVAMRKYAEIPDLALGIWYFFTYDTLLRMHFPASQWHSNGIAHDVIFHVSF